MDTNVPWDMREGSGAANAGPPHPGRFLRWCCFVSAVSLFCGCTLIKPNPGSDGNANAKDGSITDAPPSNLILAATPTDKTTNALTTPAPAPKPPRSDNLLLTGSPSTRQSDKTAVRPARGSSVEAVKGAEKLVFVTNPSTDRHASELRVSGSKMPSGGSAAGTSVVISSASQLIVKGPPRPLRTPGESSRLLTILIIGLSITIVVLTVHVARQRLPRRRARKMRNDDLVMPSDFRMKDSAIEPVKAMGLLATSSADDTSFWERFRGGACAAVQCFAAVLSKAKDVVASAVAFMRKDFSPQTVQQPAPAEKPLDSVVH